MLGMLSMGRMPAAPNIEVKQQEDCNDKAGAN